MSRLPDGTLEPEPLDGPEFGIRLGETIIVGPGWACQAEVLDSFHAFDTRLVYGQLVQRDTSDSEWKETHGDLI